MWINVLLFCGNSPLKVNTICAIGGEFFSFLVFLPRCTLLVAVRRCCGHEQLWDCGTLTKTKRTLEEKLSVTQRRIWEKLHHKIIIIDQIKTRAFLYFHLIKNQNERLGSSEFSKKIYLWWRKWIIQKWCFCWRYHCYFCCVVASRLIKKLNFLFKPEGFYLSFLIQRISRFKQKFFQIFLFFSRNAHAILSPFTLYEHTPTKILPDLTFTDAAAGSNPMNSSFFFSWKILNSFDQKFSKNQHPGECHSVALANGNPTDLFVWGGSLFFLDILGIQNSFLKIFDGF